MAGQILTYQGGRMRPGSPDRAYQTKEEWLQDLEAQRRAGVRKRRDYYEGLQYDAANEACLRTLGEGNPIEGGEKALARALAQWTGHLPEHLRLHAYSTHLMEAIDFVTNRLAGGFQVEVENAEEKRIIDAALDASPELAGTKDDDEMTVDGPTRESVVTGDTPVLLRWDRIKQTVWMEFWDSEMVEMRFIDNRQDLLEKVIVEEVTWRFIDGEEKQVTIRRVWEVQQRILNMDVVEIGGVLEMRRECVESVYLLNEQGEQEVLVDEIPWGVPFLPWWVVRCGKKSLRSTRGESLITDAGMTTADRYNALEQLAFLIARYNSHANLVVSGDAALMIEAHAKKLNKDVADVLTFPGATDATVISLPTDPQMIEHQKEVLTDSLYGCMGVTRVDQASLEGLGGVTGYALEILNQKSDGTFSRIRKQLIRDWKKLLNLVLDCYAYWSKATEDQAGQQFAMLAQIDLAEGVEETAPGYDEIDPLSDFPTRGITIVMGTGYVVDDVKIRDDYAAKLISQQEALRQRGYSPDRIKDVMDEMREAAETALKAAQAAFDTNTEGTGSSGRNQTQSGSATNNTTRNGTQKAGQNGSGQRVSR